MLDVVVILTVTAMKTTDMVPGMFLRESRASGALVRETSTMRGQDNHLISREGRLDLGSIGDEIRLVDTVVVIVPHVPLLVRKPSFFQNLILSSESVGVRTKM